MKNLLLILFTFCAILISCKKDRIEELRPTTFADFEKIMSNDADFNNFISTSLKLEKITTSGYSPTVVINSKLPRVKVFTEQELTELKSIKDFESLAEFLKENKVEDAEQKIIDLKAQSLYFYNFISKYPEFRTLTKQEKTTLIHNSIKAKDNFNMLVNFNFANSKNKLMSGDPVQMYGLAIQACQDQYRIAFDAIWAGADVAMVFGSFSGGLTNVGIFAGACVATYFIDQARGACMDSAATGLYMTM